MALQWPTQLDDSRFEDVFDLAQTFELYCAKVYDHATLHPDDVAPADYMMQFVSQAYRAVHSLHMHKKASEYLDLDIATADLQRDAAKYREACNLESTAEPRPTEIANLPAPENEDENEETSPRSALADLLNGNFEDEDEEDSDWEESEEETDDEYYEYCEGSDVESELGEMRVVTGPEGDEPPSENQHTLYELPDKVSISEKEQSNSAPLPPAPTPPTASILQDQAMRDRITAALENMSFASGEPEPTPSEQTRTQSAHSTVPSTTSSSQDTQSDATAVQTNSNQDAPPLVPSVTAPPEKMTRKSSLDAFGIHRKLSKSSSPNGIPQRLRTVCYKYVRRAMVPVRGKVQ
ncbi:hypothetical protein N7468_008319 [Penicillium chermesinum]|uniref:Uncharacterized protein n=1 Tax=Penicillium chermesinum TaxID=63820 RepID=A0A9W9NPJ2_9EURO|nr:uncharacterized protein N7468_008319 [Penicillium chermesinum]KAJ5223777.1 hypothetical protein N7468_008319 [Penicillium chermesinum]KAJ6155396.1 hypothetical protein N7470_005962 [Penicillium chermesinum]